MKAMHEREAKIEHEEQQFMKNWEMKGMSDHIAEAGVDEVGD